MKKFILMMLVMVGGVLQVHAWKSVYLNDDYNNWGSGTSHPFTRTDGNTFYIDLNDVELLKLRTDDYHFRFYVYDDKDTGQEWQPNTDNDVISSTDYKNCKTGSSGSFKISKTPHAKSVRISLSYNNSDTEWKWHVTASVTSYSKTSKVGYVNDPSKTQISPDVYAYVWDSSNSDLKILGMWPGKKMTPNTDGSYYLENVSYSDNMKVIFNVGSSTTETSTMNFEQDAVYNFTEKVSSRPITISSSGISTFSSAYPLDFTSAETAAYTISSISQTAATLNKIEGTVPARTGLILMGTASSNEDIPTAITTSAVGTNYLHAAVTATEIDTDGKVYVLKSGEFHPADAGTIPAGKAYLLASDIPGEARSLSLVFDDEAASIEGISERSVKNLDFFNLAGQRITTPSKGLYIVNGKKVIVK